MNVLLEFTGMHQLLPWWLICNSWDTCKPVASHPVVSILVNWQAETNWTRFRCCPAPSNQLPSLWRWNIEYNYVLFSHFLCVIYEWYEKDCVLLQKWLSLCSTAKMTERYLSYNFKGAWCVSSTSNEPRVLFTRTVPSRSGKAPWAWIEPWVRGWWQLYWIVQQIGRSHVTNKTLHLPMGWNEPENKFHPNHLGSWKLPWSDHATLPTNINDTRSWKIFTPILINFYSSFAL